MACLLFLLSSKELCYSDFMLLWLYVYISLDLHDVLYCVWDLVNSMICICYCLTIQYCANVVQIIHAFQVLSKRVWCWHKKYCELLWVFQMRVLFFETEKCFDWYFLYPYHKCYNFKMVQGFWNNLTQRFTPMRWLFEYMHHNSIVVSHRIIGPLIYK